MIYSINNNKVSEVHRKNRRRGIWDYVRSMNSSEQTLYSAYMDTVNRIWGSSSPSFDHSPTTEIEWTFEDD